MLNGLSFVNASTGWAAGSTKDGLVDGLFITHDGGQHWTKLSTNAVFQSVSQEEDEELLANKTGATRLGFALLLKCFQLEGKFPSAKHEIPKDVVNYVAHQLKLEASLFAQYDWEGRTIKLHRTQIQEQYHFREATVIDTEEMTSWLISMTLAADQNMEHLKAKVAERFRELKIEPPTPERVERLIQRRV